MLFTDHKPLVKAFAQRSNQFVPRRARQMAFISEFTADLEYIEGFANLTADVFSHIRINCAVNIQPGIEYKRIVKAQQCDKDIRGLLQNPESSIVHHFINMRCL